MPDESAVCRKDFESIDKIPLSPLAPGEMGVLMARAGAGKTACLTHLAIGHLLRDEPVLHVCVDNVPDKVKLWYRELLKNLFANQPDCDVPGLQHKIEPLRFIMSFMNQTFSPGKLEQGFENLKQQANFTPSLLIVDGLDFDRNDRAVFEQIRDIARRQSVRVWISARMHRHISEVNERGIPYPVDKIDDLFGSILMLEPEGENVRLKILKHNENYNPVNSDLLLDPQTFLLVKKPV
ncbi:MAG: AAA family ATPase [Syntrophobacteraceae bacterium]